MVGKLSLNDRSTAALTATSTMLNGHSTTTTNGQSTSKDIPSSKSQNKAAAEYANSDEEFAAALMRPRRTNGAEQRPTDAGESKLVQSKTRMRRKKKKKPVEGSLAKPSAPNGELNKAASHGSTEPVAAHRQGGGNAEGRCSQCGS